MGTAQLIAAPTSLGTPVYQRRAIVALNLRVATPAAAQRCFAAGNVPGLRRQAAEGFEVIRAGFADDVRR
jgi:hypothetical protein